MPIQEFEILAQINFLRSGEILLQAPIGAAICRCDERDRATFAPGSCRSSDTMEKLLASIG
jgi:hypothetical protein